MKYFLFLLVIPFVLEAKFENLNSFQANFKQMITDDKAKTLTYTGKLLASKPQNAKWEYATPIHKTVYINAREVTIVEPELEQVIIKKINSNFDFFKLIKNAKKTKNGNYEAIYNETKFLIKLNKQKEVSTISYKDQFENDVTIQFSQQRKNTPINPELFIPTFSTDYDIIRD